MRIHPLFKWFGSKWSGAKHYPPPEGPIFEPFAGSAGYSLNYCDHPVTIWEANVNLLQLWQWLICEATQASILDIPINVPEGTDIRTLGLSLGQALLMKHWQRMSNLGNCWTVSPWGNKPGQWTANTRARVAEEHQAIRHWRLEPISGTRPGTYFLDPPYLYNLKYGFKDFDYVQMVRAVALIPPPSLIIACEAVCPKTGRVPDYLPFRTGHRQVTSRRKAEHSHHSSELVYVERRSLNPPAPSPA